MTEIADLSARRWETIDDPAKFDPADALRAALRAIEKGCKPEHIIVAFGHAKEDGSSGTRFFQSGSYRYHSQLGLIEEAKLMIRDGG